MKSKAYIIAFYKVILVLAFSLENIIEKLKEKKRKVKTKSPAWATCFKPLQNQGEPSCLKECHTIHHNYCSIVSVFRENPKQA